MPASATSPAVKRSGLWFGLFGGAVAWVVHLVGASLVSEWGCFSGLDRWQFLGLSAVTWMLIAITVITLLVALAATWAAYRIDRRYREVDPEESEAHSTDVFMARTGVLTSSLFVFIILAESVPILFWLTEC